MMSCRTRTGRREEKQARFIYCEIEKEEIGKRGGERKKGKENSRI